jgi:hypothetical protein
MKGVPEWKRQMEYIEQRAKEERSKPEHLARYDVSARVDGGQFWVAANALCDVCGKIGWVLAAYNDYGGTSPTVCEECLIAAFAQAKEKP